MLLVTIYNCNEVILMIKNNIIFQLNKKSGVVYAYEDRPYWDPEKKQSRSKRKLIGKVDPVTGNIVATRGRKTKEAGNQTKETPVQKADSKEVPAYPIDVAAIIGKVLIFLRLFMCETLAERVLGRVVIVVGVANSRISELIGLCDKSVHSLKTNLENGEVDNLFKIASGGRKRKLAEVEEAIIEEINNGSYHSHQQIADMIYEKHGIKVSLPVISRLLKKTA
jgi:transposase